MTKRPKSLKAVADSPLNILNEARMLFRSHKKITLVVEGNADRDFLTPLFMERPIRFKASNGKLKSLDMLECLSKWPKDEKNGVYFLIDVDYDHLCNKIRKDPNLIYSFYCNESEKFFFNDIEVFLVNSNALKKLLINLHPGDEFNFYNFIEKLERFSRKIGIIRAANEKLANKETILDGVDLFDFVSFDNSNLSNWDMDFDSENLRKRLLLSSPRKNDIDDLFEKADELDRTEPPWRLSRGHDVTKILKNFLLHHTQKYLLKEDKSGKQYALDVEVLLRLAVDTNDFLKTNVGVKILQILDK
ncbi:DUF4435 domain-containing protein [Neisseria dentiae]|uniref:DUF4435 domain-containing protein n=1 Tax=Neisseria dentiae TaxID=194197 RepID=UPI0035A13F1A